MFRCSKCDKKQGATTKWYKNLAGHWVSFPFVMSQRETFWKEDHIKNGNEGLVFVFSKFKWKPKLVWLVPFFFLSFFLRSAASQNHLASIWLWKAMNLPVFSRLTVSGSQSSRTMREVNQIPVMVLTCGRGQGLWLQGAQTGPSGWLGGVSVGGGKGHGL